MYRSFYGLRNHPFGLNPDPRYLFLTSGAREALACLQLCMQRANGLMVMIGEVGTGKTTLLRGFMHGMKRLDWPFAYVFNPSLTPDEFLEYLLADLEIPCSGQSKAARLVALNEFLLRQYQSRKVTFVIIDEAQQLRDDVLEQVRLLTNLETDQQKLLQVVLAGQPELGDKLESSHLRQLKQRIFLRCKLPLLEEKETRDYILWRLKCAGATTGLVFTEDSIKAIHHLSGGIPRVINTICEHSLIHGYVKDLRPIDRATVENVAAELNLVPERDLRDFTEGEIDPARPARERS